MSELNNSPYSRTLWDKHNKDFFEKNSLDSFDSKMKDLKKDIDPRFFEQFDSYTEKVKDLLSKNQEVENDSGVQKEVAIQNSRVASAMLANSTKLKIKYRSIMNLDEAANDDDYSQAA